MSQISISNYFDKLNLWNTILSNIFGTSKPTNRVVDNMEEVIFIKSVNGLNKRDSVTCHSSARKKQLTNLKFSCGSSEVTIGSNGQLVYPICQDFCSSTLNLNNGRWSNGTVTMDIDNNYRYTDTPSTNELKFNCNPPTPTNTTTTTIIAQTTQADDINFQLNTTTPSNTTIVPDGCCKIIPENAQNAIERITACDCPIDRTGSTCHKVIPFNCEVVKTSPDMNCFQQECPQFDPKDDLFINFYLKCFNNPNTTLVNRQGFTYFTNSSDVLYINLVGHLY